MSNDRMWERGLKELDCNPNENQLSLLKQYVDLLERWNKTYNLTAVRDPKEMIPLHIFDSLAVADFIKGKHLLDVGSGAGLPTLPLAIIQPERHFTALDTNGKKSRFIQQAMIELGLKNVCVEQARVEKWLSPIKYDGVISRAFASIHDFVTSSSSHLTNDGTLYAMKGKYPVSELQYLPKRFSLHQEHKLLVPFVEGERHLLKFKIKG